MKSASPYINREWSWIDFDRRVLEEAEDAANPLLERVRFLGIVSSNLDEFFMVRVAGVRHQIAADVRARGHDGLRPQQVMDGIASRVGALVKRQYELWRGELRPALEARGVRFAEPGKLDASGQRFVRRYFEDVVMPTLTPLAVGPGHPFPNLVSGQLYLAVRVTTARSRLGGEDVGGQQQGPPLVFVQVPKVLPRFVRVRSEREGEILLVPLERLVADNLELVLGAGTVLSSHVVRVTRDAELESDPTASAVDDDAASDLLAAVQREILLRRRGAAIRLEHGGLPPALKTALRRELELEPADLYRCPDLLQLGDLGPVVDSLEAPGLKYEPLPPLPMLPAERRGDLFAQIRQRSRLLFHPYAAFDPVVRLVEAAASDPHVLAIKMTLYRVGAGSPIVAALVRAAASGKQVTALVELRARFDEERNIDWARQLEEAGAHVIHGLHGLKTHCKALLIVRREGDGIRRYVHLGTGNYNANTARVYSDFGLLSCEEELGRDVGTLFNVLTGNTEPPPWEKIEISPTGLRRRVLHLIEREKQSAAAGAPARIIAKVNALVDTEVIAALGEASRAGVQIDLIVRGICCLTPGLPGVSENIRVRSVVGRFLEHARAFYFHNGGAPRLYLSSADWMPRNFDRRVELLFPVEDPELATLVQRLLELQLADDVKARVLGADGRWLRVPGRRRGISCQLETYATWKRAARPAGRREPRFVPVRGRKREAPRKG